MPDPVQPITSGEDDLGGAVIGIDLGGTNLQVGVVDRFGRVVHREHRKTNAEEGFEAVLDRIEDGVRSACHAADVDFSDIIGVGIAAAGAVDIRTGVVVMAPNLKWENAPLRDRLHARLRLPVHVDNDVNAAVWGEWRRGAARNMGDTLGIWVGTGVGGGLILNGRVYHGAFLTAGEVGHTVILPGEPRGSRTVEDLCSRTGMSRQFEQRIAAGGKTIVAEALRADGYVRTPVLVDALANGDAMAREIVDRAAHLLGISVANWVTVLALDNVILGGGITEALGEQYVSKVRESFEAVVFPERNRACRLLVTKLEADAGVIGAAMLAVDRVNANG